MCSGNGGHRAPVVTALFLAVATVAGGCGHCSMDEDTVQMFDLAEMLYRSGRFDDAIGRYENVLKNCRDHYQAWIGMGNASREYGNDLFKAAHELAVEGKRDKAREMFDNAVAKHQDAFRCFYGVAREMKPDDLQWRMGLGIFWYQRATSMVSFPYPLDDKENRRRDRDKAIKQFMYIVGKVPNSYQAHNHLSILLLTAGRYDEAIVHLQKYHHAIQTLYDFISHNWPDDDVKLKEKKAKALEDLQKDIRDVRELVVIYKDELRRQRESLIAKEAGLTAQQRLKEGEELKQRVARLTRQTLTIEKLIEDFVITELSPEEKVLRERCVAYLREFNGGNLIKALAFLDPPAETRRAVRKRIVAQVEKEIRYAHPQFRGFDITGDTAKVTFDCNLMSDAGTKKGVRLVIGWRQVGGHWMVSEIP